VQANALYSVWKLEALGSFNKPTALEPPYNVTPAMPTPQTPITMCTEKRYYANYSNHQVLFLEPKAQVLQLQMSA
jgi:hypothetical protein